MTGWHEALMANTYVEEREREIQRELERRHNIKTYCCDRESNADRFVRGMRHWLHRDTPKPHRHN